MFHFGAFVYRRIGPRQPEALRVNPWALFCVRMVKQSTALLRGLVYTVSASITDAAGPANSKEKQIMPA